jgi:hypothetical protein
MKYALCYESDADVVAGALGYIREWMEAIATP